MNPMAVKVAISARQKTRRKNTPQSMTIGLVILARRRDGMTTRCSCRGLKISGCLCLHFSTETVVSADLKSRPIQATMDLLQKMRPVLLRHLLHPLPKLRNAVESSKAMKIEART
jgi:hypothetical protein